MEGVRRETTDDSERSGGSSGEESREATGISACSNEEAAKGNSADKRTSRTEQEPQSRESVKLYSESGWQREASSGNDERWRRPASRDYSRVIHSPSFRRLQGKTQVFPVTESDFFRNRLTHSLEVAQIAEGIAQKLNYEYAQFSNEPIDERLCVTAALIHDLGHPPFGHNGERALDDMMRPYGGFEGNAQTIRIIARVEKKLRRDEHDLSELIDGDDDNRVGLALTYRTILSALKYDRLIPHMRGDEEGLVKGYYFTERQLIERAKSAVDHDWKHRKKFKTLECSIMDIADDIAYSTFDLEDSLKAGFITPAAILSTDESVFARVAAKANKALSIDNQIDSKDALGVFLEIFSSIFSKGTGPSANIDSDGFIDCYKRSVSFAEDGYVRTALSSELVGKAIRSVKLRYNDEAPWLSEAYLPPDILKKVEVLKHFTFESTIFTARVKVGEYRGYEVVKGIFKALAEPKGSLLMPEDLRAMHKQLEHDATARHRAICDFVAGMTDRYALEFYARLYSDEPESIFKPV